MRGFYRFPPPHPHKSNDDNALPPPGVDSGKGSRHVNIWGRRDPTTGKRINRAHQAYERQHPPQPAAAPPPPQPTEKPQSVWSLMWAGAQEALERRDAQERASRGLPPRQRRPRVRWCARARAREDHTPTTTTTERGREGGSTSSSPPSVSPSPSSPPIDPEEAARALRVLAYQRQAVQDLCDRALFGPTFRAEAKQRVADAAPPDVPNETYEAYLARVIANQPPQQRQPRPRHTTD